MSESIFGDEEDIFGDNPEVTIDLGRVIGDAWRQMSEHQVADIDHAAFLGREMAQRYLGMDAIEYLATYTGADFMTDHEQRAAFVAAFDEERAK